MVGMVRFSVAQEGERCTVRSQPPPSSVVIRHGQGRVKGIMSRRRDQSLWALTGAAITSKSSIRVIR